MKNKTATPQLVHAFCNPLAEGLPADIQWMPPGKHEINASQDGKPIQLSVEVTDEIAIRMNDVLSELLRKAEAGEGDRPFIDFNHEDREASAHVQSFYWGGDDPVRGGVRMRVEWTDPGKAGVKGRAWRRFSPSFYFTKRDGAVEITGAPINMGGLVNRAAFKSIAPIWSKELMVDEGRLRALATKLGVKYEDLTKALSEDETGEETKPGGQPPQNPNKKMDKEESNRLAALETTVKELTTKVTAAENKNLVLETQLSAVKANSEVQAKAFAGERVRAAVQAGKIPAQAADIIEKWTNLIAADAKNAELLDQLPENPALKKLVENPGKPGATTTATNAGDGEETPFVVKAREYGKEHGIKDELEAQAAFAGTKDGGELYKAFRSNYASAPDKK